MSTVCVQKLLEEGELVMNMKLPVMMLEGGQGGQQAAAGSAADAASMRLAMSSAAQKRIGALEAIFSTFRHSSAD